MIIQKLFTVDFLMWSNAYASRAPSVSIRWQNKRKKAWQKTLGVDYRHSSIRRKVVILDYILRSNENDYHKFVKL